MSTEQTLRIYPLALQKIRSDENHVYLKMDPSAPIELDPRMLWSSGTGQRSDDGKSLSFMPCTNTTPLSSMTKKRSMRLTEKTHASTGANKRLNEILLLNSELPFSSFINQDGLLMCSVCLIRRAAFPIWKLCDHCYRHWNVFKMFWPLRAPCWSMMAIWSTFWIKHPPPHPWCVLCGRVFLECEDDHPLLEPSSNPRSAWKKLA